MLKRKISDIEGESPITSDNDLDENSSSSVLTNSSTEAPTSIGNDVYMYM